MGDESCIGHYYTQCFGLAKTQQSSSPQGLRSAVSNSLDSYLPGSHDEFWPGCRGVCGIREMVETARA
jgi:hypothetical protein